MMLLKYFIFFASVLVLGPLVEGQDYSFPSDFLFGVATASYQVEGGWNEGGKGENIWDRLTHDHPDWVADGSSGDVACDTYHKAIEDVQLLVDLGVNFYRFSLSWSRILPSGFINNVNQDGIDYYNNLINELLRYNITPLVTLYHWDLPQPLQDIGGWPNSLLADYYGQYARVVFSNFGDRVKMWLTFNEPKQTCLSGYGDGGMAPAYQQSGIGDYLCTHTLLKAHANAYHIYNDEFRSTQQGRVGITLDVGWEEPGSDNPLDLEAQDRDLQFNVGWYAHPIFTEDGDYPEVMRDRISARSAAEGFVRSRLPVFTPEEITYIRGTSDFFGLNHYSTNYVGNQDDAPIGYVSYYNDKSTATWLDSSWPGSASDWLKVVPWGIRSLLNWLKNEYNNPEIYITENGFSDTGTLQDDDRVYYYRSYLSNILDAVIEDGCNVKGYTAWSFMDNFEWRQGYTQRFGIYYVDFDSPERTRTPKRSAQVYRDIIASRTITWD